jgi:hypothetical protein
METMTGNCGTCRIDDLPQLANTNGDSKEAIKLLKNLLRAQPSISNATDCLLYMGDLSPDIWQVLCENCPTGSLMVPHGSFDVTHLKYKSPMNTIAPVRRLYVLNLTIKAERANSLKKAVTLLHEQLDQLFIRETQPFDKLKKLLEIQRIDSLAAVCIHGVIRGADIQFLNKNAPNLAVLDVTSDSVPLNLTIFMCSWPQLTTLIVRSPVLHSTDQALTEFDKLNVLQLFDCAHVTRYNFVFNLNNVSTLTIAMGSAEERVCWVQRLGATTKLRHLDLSEYRNDTNSILNNLLSTRLSLCTLKLNRKPSPDFHTKTMLTDPFVIKFLASESATKHLRELELNGQTQLTAAILDCDESKCTPRGLISLAWLDLRGTKCNIQQPGQPRIQDIITNIAVLKDTAARSGMITSGELSQTMKIHITYDTNIDYRPPAAASPLNLQNPSVVILDCWDNKQERFRSPSLLPDGQHDAPSTSASAAASTSGPQTRSARAASMSRSPIPRRRLSSMQTARFEAGSHLQTGRRHSLFRQPYVPNNVFVITSFVATCGAGPRGSGRPPPGPSKTRAQGSDTSTGTPVTRLSRKLQRDINIGGSTTKS